MLSIGTLRASPSTPHRSRRHQCTRLLDDFGRDRSVGQASRSVAGVQVRAGAPYRTLPRSRTNQASLGRGTCSRVSPALGTDRTSPGLERLLRTLRRGKVSAQALTMVNGPSIAELPDHPGNFWRRCCERVPDSHRPVSGDARSDCEEASDRLADIAAERYRDPEHHSRERGGFTTKRPAQQYLAELTVATTCGDYIVLKRRPRHREGVGAAAALHAHPYEAIGSRAAGDRLALRCPASLGRN